MIFQFKYKSKIKYTKAKFLPEIDSIEDDPNFTIFTFRKIKKCKLFKVIKNVSAITKINNFITTKDVIFYGIQTDSPLAPIFIWDAAHSIPVGGTITFKDDFFDLHYLEREYFKNSFEYRNGVFHKIKKLLAEESSLYDWTFGIPVGPEDATLLNVCVKRILDLDVPKKEIILCGRPAKNFLYWDKVKIVGEDITAPPVKICAKKNRIAKEAKYDNLCIIHERVLLPLNFMEAVKEFGDFYPLTAFQSLYFDDKWNFVPRRYSDFGIAQKLSSHNSKGLMRNDEKTPNKFAPIVFPALEKSEFLFANPHRLSKNTFPTGSLYLCKKKIWEMCPQNEALNWIEFEDVEHANRAEELGIPSRVNPYTFTQSLISRPILTVLGASHIETNSGESGSYRSILEALPFPRKPLIKKTEEQSVKDAITFINKYAYDANIPSVSSSSISTAYRLKMIARAVYGTRIPIQRDKIQEYLLDFEKLIISDQLPYGWREDIAERICYSGREALIELFEKNPSILNHAGQRNNKRVFINQISDYLQKRSLLVYIGSFVSAILLGFQNHRSFVFPKGILWRYKTIINSTPFIDLLEGKK